MAVDLRNNTLMNIRSFLPVFFIFISYVCVVGQESANGHAEVYNGFDNLVGIENTAIFHGAEYIEEHRMVNEKHKFFQTRNFREAQITYDGKIFYDVPAKYSIWDDELLVNLEGETRTSTFKLFKNRLGRFTLGSYEFVSFYSPESPLSGIYELLWKEGSLQVLKKHRINEKEVSKNRYIHYEFEPASPKYYFVIGENIKEVTRKNILEVFPENKSLVREKYRTYRRQSKHRRDQSLINMFEILFQASKGSAL